MSAHLPTPQYVYRAALVRVVDGDTLALRVDLGCHVYRLTTIRVLGVNTPEKVGATATAGHAASAWVLSWLCTAALACEEWPLVIRTELDKDDRYGRLLARVYRISDGEELTPAIIAAGMGVDYDGGKR